jgi:hypothetical protein
MTNYIRRAGISASVTLLVILASPAAALAAGNQWG